jgi:hypothetical protein
VNLLMPFARRGHVDVCVEQRVDVVVVAFGGDRHLVERLGAAGALIRLQSPAVPVFSPLAPLEGMPASAVDCGALYAGETALRISEVTSARQAVEELTPT